MFVSSQPTRWPSMLHVPTKRSRRLRAGSDSAICGWGLSTAIQPPPVQSAAVPSTTSLTLVSRLQSPNIELLHRQEGLGEARDLVLCAAPQHFVHLHGNDLPREPILILQPAALLGFGDRGEFLPVVIDLVLCLAVHDEGD